MYESVIVEVCSDYLRMHGRPYETELCQKNVAIYLRYYFYNLFYPKSVLDIFFLKPDGRIREPRESPGLLL